MTGSKFLDLVLMTSSIAVGSAQGAILFAVSLAEPFAWSCRGGSVSIR
jgi:hypothetical protein